MTSGTAGALDLERYTYDLPPERIAQHPLPERDASRLLHVTAGALEDRRFTELPGLLRPGDLLVANDTRVRAARLLGRTDDGTDAELLVLRRLDDDRCLCLVRPGRRLHAGAVVRLGDATATVEGAAPEHPGARVVRFDRGGAALDDLVELRGTAPLPPYITEPLADASRYQTLHARGAPVSAAAPTAGLHFTPRVHAALRERGVAWTTVTLEVGIDTFAPIRTPRIDEHRMHRERCTVPADAAGAIAAARARGGRVIAVGTTVVRTLETHASDGGGVTGGSADTDLYLRPGSRFRVVDGLLTNFHQPRSSLLVLLAAFTGERWRDAYAHALAAGYRFLSFGDCMLCWRAEP